MGTGIAQVAATAGHRVLVADAVEGATTRARRRIEDELARQVEKGRIDRVKADEILSRIVFRADALGDDVSCYAGCGLLIEAVIEDLPAKQALFRRLENALPSEAVLASNTSSLAISAIAGGLAHPERVIGMHFFNPAPVLPLVEVVPWLGTTPSLPPMLRDLAKRWGKVPVISSDTPGFIVNRVARPFYGESLRILEEGIADAATIDWAMREIGSFRMGPFELMDLIGNDVNYTVTRSIFEAFFFDPRYRPSLTQKQLVDAGRLGRKSGRGYYDYGKDAQTPAPRTDANLGQLVFERVLAMLINSAVDALAMRVASAEDIDLAMTKGVNYPKGLLAWADEIGPPRVLEWLERLEAEYHEDRYRPSPLLRRTAVAGGRFLS